MSHLYQIPADTFLVTARQYGFMIREMIEFYEVEQAIIPGWRMTLVSETAQDFYNLCVYRIRTVYGVTFDDISEHDLGILLDRVLMDGESWGSFCFYLERVIDGGFEMQ